MDMCDDLLISIFCNNISKGDFFNLCLCCKRFSNIILHGKSKLIEEKWLKFDKLESSYKFISDKYGESIKFNEWTAYQKYKFSKFIYKINCKQFETSNNSKLLSRILGGIYDVNISNNIYKAHICCNQKSIKIEFDESKLLNYNEDIIAFSKLQNNYVYLTKNITNLSIFRYGFIDFNEKQNDLCDIKHFIYIYEGNFIYNNSDFCDKFNLFGFHPINSQSILNIICTLNINSKIIIFISKDETKFIYKNRIIYPLIYTLKNIKSIAILELPNLIKYEENLLDFAKYKFPQIENYFENFPYHKLIDNNSKDLFFNLESLIKLLTKLKK
jgi:hypothetical protein